ncbi:MAG TPA: MFS transporter, partial [Ktedonobacteraceae bacterium]|nr:MFS transporter [Ktedonobacteraceae bacterium]
MRTTSQRATARRWWMLLLLSLGFVELTLNWFDIASAFPALSQQFRLQIPQLALLISVFIAGYAIFHIPTGFLAYRFGVRNILLAGLLLESLGSIAIAFAPDYTWLVVLRFVTGIGGSFFVGCGFSMVTSWFRGRELALAMGIAGGGAFALGSALGLFAWVGIVQSTSWPVALVIGGVAGLVVFLLSLLFLRAPNDEAARLNTHHFSWSAVGRVLGNRDLWFLGLCFFGIYGAGLTLDQLISEYVGIVYHVPAATGGLMAAVLTLMAVPGSIIGGFLSDRVKRLKPVIVIPWIIMGLGFIVLPFVNVSGLWVLIVVMGA